jgi:hypothetical protein
MNSKHVGCVLVSIAALVLTSCGSEPSGSSDAKDADNTASPSPTESQSPSPKESESASSKESKSPELPPGWRPATNPVPCESFTAPAGFDPASTLPPQCAFESSDARVSIGEGPAPASFEQLLFIEENTARSSGAAPPALEQVSLDGWTFAAIWPEVGGYTRMDRYLVGSAGNGIACKLVVEDGNVDATTHAEFCGAARDVLHKP